jgi:hypothetical protein
MVKGTGWTLVIPNLRGCAHCRKANKEGGSDKIARRAKGQLQLSSQTDASEVCVSKVDLDGIDFSQIFNDE